MPLNEPEQKFLKETLPFWAKLTPEQALGVVNGSGGAPFFHRRHAAPRADRLRPGCM
jgi:hypothetical protein